MFPQNRVDPDLAFSNFKPDYFDLAILDIKMPKMDGFELYNKIRKIDNQVKVCFITATNKIDYENIGETEQQNGGQEEMQQRYCALNKDMFLQKPISNDLLLEINKRIGG